MYQLLAMCQEYDFYTNSVMYVLFLPSLNFIFYKEILWQKTKVILQRVSNNSAPPYMYMVFPP